jgi:glycine cleavage system H lipoate-binding protein
MSNKIYKSAMGKPVDLGALLLQNENTRAVGNMNINARGDVVDSNNRVVERKNRQVQRHYQRQTNVSNDPVVASARSAKMPVDNVEVDLSEFSDLPEDNDVVIDKTPEVNEAPRGGLAAAIARSREVKQELDKTPRQQAQSQGLKRI